jgi:molybdopterin/thiamine biosynthesis adenylyltransferase
MEPIERSRQSLIPGWDQRRIEKGHLLLIGGCSNPLGELISVGAIALGTRLTLLKSHSTKSFTLFTDGDIFKFLNLLRTLFYDAQVQAFGVRLDHLLKSLLDEVHLVVDCTGDPVSVEGSMKLARSLDSSLIVIRAYDQGLQMFWNPKDVRDIPDEPITQYNLATAFIGAGIVLHELRRILCPLDGDVEPDPMIAYELEIGDLLIPIDDIAQIGAGGIGGALALAAGTITSALHLWDGDITDPTNRARNPWLSVGEPKVFSLKRWMEELLGVKCIAHPEYVTSPRFLEDVDVSLLLAAPDNWKARMLADEAARAKGIPMITGGCSPMGATAYICMGDGGPACLRCRKPDLNLMLQMEARSCSSMPQGSVLMTNWMAAGFMAHLCQNSLYLDQDAFAGVVEFNASYPLRFIMRSQQRCKCNGVDEKSG